jgi:transposase
MFNKSKLTVATMGIDHGKNSFHIVASTGVARSCCGRDYRAASSKRAPRKMPRCLIGMEACVGAHHLSRGLQSHGSSPPALTNHFNELNKKSLRYANLNWWRVI